MGGPTPQPNQQAPGAAGHSRVQAKAAQQLRASTRRFDGQLPGEQVVWIKRQSPWYLLITAWPMVIGLLGLGALASLLGVGPGAARLLEIVIGVALLVYLVYWLVTGFWTWFFTLYILTDQRVVTSRGYFHRTTGEIPLKSVAQVLVERMNALQIALHVGDLMVRPLGTPLNLPGIANPREVADSILAVQDDPSLGADRAAAGGARIPGVRSQRIQDALDKLAEPMAAPVPPTLIRPPFGGLLHRKIPIRLFEGEAVVEVVYRHWWVLLVRELPALAGMALGIGLSLYLRLGGPLAAYSTLVFMAGILGGGLFVVLVYLNYVDDVFVLTTHRVIDVDRLLFILSEYSNDAPYARVQNVHVERNAIGQALGFGTIVVETSGRRYPITMSDIPHAFAVMDRIFFLLNQTRERESINNVNKQKQENHRWIATVLDELLVAVPDVRGLPYLDALARAKAAGLKLVVDAERLARGRAAGVVLDQVPSPGVIELTENEIRVILSGRGAPAVP
ncbi:MAG TPA: PH domain-containing protein [Ktedonobacterales bacterium]|nr:PH domain-containing protein [Ktedonobacterales bacterium]